MTRAQLAGLICAPVVLAAAGIAVVLVVGADSPVAEPAPIGAADRERPPRPHTARASPESPRRVQSATPKAKSVSNPTANPTTADRGPDLDPVIDAALDKIGLHADDGARAMTETVIRRAVERFVRDVAPDASAQLAGDLADLVAQEWLRYLARTHELYQTYMASSPKQPQRWTEELTKWNTRLA